MISILKNKKGVEFSFAWIFSLIVGAVILFLAIYAAVRLVTSEKQARNAEVGRQFEVLLSPIETSIENAASSSIEFSVETRIYNDCKTAGNFGAQELSASVSSSIGPKWQKPKNPNIFYNKYVFSSDVVEGKKFYLFSESFNMPYKIADAIFLWSENEKYCFIDAPNEVEEDLSSLNLNINLSSSVNNCPKNSTTVCFASTGCDVDVYKNTKKVVKKGQKTVYYDDSFGRTLLYAAIFSNSLNYECQLTRLMKRNSQLASLYSEKSAFLTLRGCPSSNIQPLLESYSNSTLKITESIKINSVASSALTIEEVNNALICKLF